MLESSAEVVLLLLLSLIKRRSSLLSIIRRRGCRSSETKFKIAEQNWRKRLMLKPDHWRKHMLQLSKHLWTRQKLQQNIHMYPPYWMNKIPMWSSGTLVFMSICSRSIDFFLLFKYLSSWVPLKLQAWSEMQYLVIRFAQVSDDIHAFWKPAWWVASRKHDLIKPLSMCAYWWPF